MRNRSLMSSSPKFSSAEILRACNHRRDAVFDVWPLLSRGDGIDEFSLIFHTARTGAAAGDLLPAVRSEETHTDDYAAHAAGLACAQEAQEPLHPHIHTRARVTRREDCSAAAHAHQ